MEWWKEWIDDVEALTALASSSLNQAAVRRIGKQLLRPADSDLLQQIRVVRSADGTAHLKRVAIPVDTWVTEEMLIFPDETHRALEQCFTRTLERDYARLGMGESIRATANPGVMFLFSGASGVGKTLASSWLASRLGAPLFKIDLALVLNKYIGETEKNISLALDEAAKSDVILLFDEADALFGKRTDSSHSGDRYSNMLTNYLLSRIETHPGIVILTTNAGGRMDPAFQRRIDIAIEFQSLQYRERIRLWEAMLADRNPGRALCQRIARYCELPPGNVRNVVINACCWHPDETPLSAHAIWLGLDEEYRKVGRSMPSQLMALKENRFRTLHNRSGGNDG
ncbi:MAG: ATP-binding protein [Gammaproteobacteria bacterium]